MHEITTNFFSIKGFMPHGHCFFWKPSILWTLVASNFLIALAYYSIPVSLIVAIKRHTSQYPNWIILMFSAFIFACDTTHVIDILTIWYPNYWLDAAAKSVTATISAATAVALWPIVNTASSYVENTERKSQTLTDANSELISTLDKLEKQRAGLQFIK